MATIESVVARGVEVLSGSRGLPLVHYSLDVNGAPTRWRVRRISFSEAVQDTYTCVLDLAHDDLDADATALQGASCAVQIARGQAARRVCGLVTRVEWLGTLVDHLMVRVHVSPALAALRHTRDSRIFQNQTIPDILQKVLGDGLKPYQRKVRPALGRAYQAREYTVQYGESDYDFARRLMSEEGIFFFFDHSGEQEELVLADANQECPDYTGNAVQVVGPEAPQELLHVETIGQLTVGRQLRSTGVVLRDWDWTRPALLDQGLTCTDGKPDAQGMERQIYEYPSPQVLGGYDKGQKAYTRDEGALHAQLRKEELQAGTRDAAGESNVTGLAAGMALEVDGQHLSQLGTRFLVLRVMHEGEAAEEVQHQATDARERQPRYRNFFTCADFGLPWRPPPLRRPVIPGPQTATVVGPPGEEIFTDEHGRIQVQFHWDREGKRKDGSSCWVRVAQTWGGAGWGFVFLPRIGMEVVVQFLEGNPDRPLVTGCVFNGEHPLPYELPAKKTVSTIRTSSSPGNDGYNELRFEDAAGSEELFIQAQKDMNEVVKHNHSVSVGGDQSISVTGNQSVTVKGQGQSPVHSKVDVTGKYSLDASDTMEFQAPTHIKLTCGGSTILIEPSVITITSGGNAKVVLDANGLVQSSQGSKVFLDANALTQSSAGAKTLHDANVLVQSVAGSKVLLDANALTQSSAGAKSLHDANVLMASVPGAHLVLDANVLMQSVGGAAVVLDANATVTAPTNATVQAGAAATVTAATATLAGGGGAVQAGGPGVTVGGGTVNVSGGMVSLAGGMVKIN